ncbi:MAG TPA: hypothetical protein DEG71_06710, partial [Clostridiales bacterium]|nr:hypothetical protein [Clostridiales bacterium]
MCGKKELEMEEIITKKCSKCGEEKLATKEYFSKAKNGKYGVSAECKVCKKARQTIANELKKTQPKIVKEFNVCIKCNRELPCNILYFPPDILCKTGLRNVCRECGKDGHFMENDYEVKHFWTVEEEQLLIKVYPYFLNEELIQLYFPRETLKSLTDKAYKLDNIHKTEETMLRKHRLQSERYSGENNYNYGKPKSEESKIKQSLSLKGKYVGENNKLFGIPKTDTHKKNLSIAKTKLARWKGNKNPRHINPLNGELNGRWAGGIKELYYDLRDHLQDWKKSSMEECNYKCVLTHGEFDNVHHLYNFKNIVYELFEELKLPMLKTIGEYSEEDRDLIYNLLHSKHKYYGNGVCLCKSLHKLYHDTYNYSN